MATHKNVDGKIVECMFPNNCPYGIQVKGSTTYTCQCLVYTPGEWSILTELRAIRTLLEGQSQ